MIPNECHIFRQALNKLAKARLFNQRCLQNGSISIIARVKVTIIQFKGGGIFNLQVCENKDFVVICVIIMIEDKNALKLEHILGLQNAQTKSTNLVLYG